MESGRTDLGPHSESHWNYAKIEHENGLKFWPSSNRNLLMWNIREFNHKLIKVSHVKIGLQ